MSLMASLLLTVDSALPAYIGRTNVSSPYKNRWGADISAGAEVGDSNEPEERGGGSKKCAAGATLIAITSVIGETFMETARRGMTLLIAEVVAPTT